MFCLLFLAWDESKRMCVVCMFQTDLTTLFRHEWRVYLTIGIGAALSNQPLSLAQFIALLRILDFFLEKKTVVKNWIPYQLLGTFLHKNLMDTHASIHIMHNQK